MYKTTLAAAMLALCAAMPFTASAQSSVEDSDLPFVAMWCQLNISSRPQQVFADRGTERKSSECFAAAVEVLEDSGLTTSSDYFEDLDPDVVNAYICRNRERSGGYGRQCEQFMANR